MVRGFWAIGAAALLWSASAAAQANTPADSGVARSPGAADEARHLPFRDSWLLWDNSVTAQTVGIGKSYQSANPTYETSLSLRPRYYLWERGADAWYLAGRIDLVHELTNSDVTTRRGETTLSDANLLSGYRHVLREDRGYSTTVAVALPILTFPTSKFSASNGTYFGLGTDVRFAHEVPLAGRGSKVLPKLTFGALAGYTHTFTRAVVPTNPELRRVRLDSEGRTVPGDQLIGAAFPAHELRFAGRILASITDRFTWFTELSYRPTWKYRLPEVEVCGVTATGCAPAERPEDPSTYVELTSFETSLSYTPIDVMSVSLGYVNVEIQPGADGQRRNLFYSPGAQFYLTLIGYLDAIYLESAGRNRHAL